MPYQEVYSTCSFGFYLPPLCLGKSFWTQMNFGFSWRLICWYFPQRYCTCENELGVQIPRYIFFFMMKDSKVRYFTFFMWYFFPQACDCDLGRHEVCLEHLLQTKVNIGGYVVFNVARLHDCFDFISLVQLQSTSLFWCSSRSFFNSCESLGWILAWQILKESLDIVHTTCIR